MNIAVLLSIFLFSCMATKTIAIKGSYPAPPITTSITTSKWTDIFKDCIRGNPIPSRTYDIAFGNQTYILKIDEILSAWQSYPDNSGL